MHNHQTNYFETAQALSRPRQPGMPTGSLITAKTNIGDTRVLTIFKANIEPVLLVSKLLMEMAACEASIEALGNYLSIITTIIPELLLTLKTPFQNIGVSISVSNREVTSHQTRRLTQQDVAFVIGLLALLIHKQINDSNRGGFLDARVRALRAITHTDLEFDSDSFYRQEVVPEMLSWLQNSYEVRRTLFLGFASRAEGPDIIGSTLRQSLGLMQNTGMTYLTIICSELVAVRHPILHWKALAEEVQNLRDALDFLQNQPVAVRPYVKILLSQNNTIALHRNRFNKLTLIAHQFAKRTSPTFGRLATSAPSSMEMQTILDFADRVDDLFRGSRVGAQVTDPLNLGGVEENMSLLSNAFLNHITYNNEGTQVRRNRLVGVPPNQVAHTPLVNPSVNAQPRDNDVSQLSPHLHHLFV